MSEGKLTKFGRFEEYLTAKGENLTQNQRTLAQMVLGMPRMGGKSWLIKRLAEFDAKDRERCAP